MTTTWLAYIPSPPRGVWHLGPLPIRAYALFIITGIIVALLIGDRRFAARGGERGVIYDIALWMVPFGLIGGRLYHLATDWRTYFGHGGAGFAAALRIWDGGLGIWGAIALGAVGAWIACRRRGIPLPAFLDAAAPGVVLAQAIGRLGNYFNQELYGRETTVPWGLEIFYRRDPAGFVDVHSLDGVSTGQLAVVVHPTFLYELLWNVLVFGVLIYLDRRFTIGHGRLFGLYVALYCVGRFGVELMRDDTATHIAGIRINLFTSTFVFIGAVVYVILAPKGREDPATVRGTAVVGEEAAEAEEAAEPEAELSAVASGSAAVTAVARAAGAEDDEPTESSETQRAGDLAEPHTLKAQSAASKGGASEAQQEETEEPATGEVAAEVAPEAEESEDADAEEAEEAEAEPEPVPEEPEVDEARAEESEPVVDEPEAESATDEGEPAQAEGESETGEPELAAPSVTETEAEESEVEEPEAGSDAEETEPPEAGAPEAKAGEAEAPEVEAPAPQAEKAEPDTADTESEEAESHEPPAQAQASATDAEDTTAPKPVEADASGGAEDQDADPDDHRDGDRAPRVPSSPTSDSTGSTRQGWRARLRNRRQRSGR
ncbi:MAG: prolipoprotein diacylglyceryl transferase [Mycobacterium pseudokansasii]|uniref:prolipoprotein diacylglyceryl transferase n=1 Tax=Mycobacterium pseudokansasii TaxID=2341080 RepID=UPI0023F071C7|nr:prolipoprotein diacylglyceryl transferase [Mycobacterium pseudokansasii]MBY0387103.1 prolipoprotein diacylglyceryl transferase [Mycobacterium pseudokansasii]